MHHTLTKEELKQLEYKHINTYIRTKQWLEKHYPSSKHSLDKFNHYLFHYLQKHHFQPIPLKNFQWSEEFKDWRARSVALFTIAGVIWGLVLAYWLGSIFLPYDGYSVISSLLMIIVLCVGFFPYIAAIQIIETSRYNHENETDIPRTSSIEKTDTLLKKWKKFSGLQKTEAIIGGVFLFIPIFYALFPKTFQTVCLNHYTTSLLSDDVIQIIKDFFNMDQGKGVCLLLLGGIIIVRIIITSIRFIFRIISKISPEKNTREL